MIDVSKDIKIKRITPHNNVCFFGYYDISPENKSGTKVLFQKAPFGDHMPSKSDALSLEFYSTKSDLYEKIDETTAWNFQEGCRLQWVNDTNCIYNIRLEDGYGSVVFDTEKMQIVRKYNFPIYSINGDAAIFYNFNRSRYAYAHNVGEEETEYSKDGIFIGNMASGNYKLLISLEQLSNDTGTSNCKNWVEHCVLNPAGDHFCFFHRWSDEKCGMHTRFCVSDLDGNYTVLLNQGFCSHFGWKNNSVISAWGRLPSKINSVQSNTILKNTGLYKALVKVYHSLIKNDSLRQKITNDAYVFFDINSLAKWKLENTDFTVDGHGTWSTDEELMLTDTYPDADNYRHLMIYKQSDNSVYELGRFFSYPDIRDSEKYSIVGIRCDLHPKWGADNNHIFFDSTHEGFRALYYVDISHLFFD